MQTPKISLIILAFFFFSTIKTQQNCTLDQQIQGFSPKILVNPYPEYTQSPYDNMTAEQSAIINATINNKNLVCAIKYQDSSNKSYTLSTFPSKNDALNAGFIVTHQGKCGSCSTLLDLVAYLKQGLTAPVRACGAKGFVSKDWAMNCLLSLGFTKPCADIWYYNTVNTRKDCFTECMWAWISGEPYVDDKGNLNKCLQCDEDLSGPVFKYYSGRTRRNSGIHSEIDRPSDEIYNITHCYF